MANKKILLGSAVIANSVVMLFLTFYLIKLPWLAGDEKLLIWTTSAIKFNNRELPQSENFALINTSYDISLIDKLDDFGFPVGQQVITDRAKLTRLLEIINRASIKPKYIICDIHFLEESVNDKKLSIALSKFDNIIISSHLDDKNQLEYPIFKDVNRGLSDYVIGSVFDGVYKYQLIYNDSLQLTPLKVHLDISKKEIDVRGPLVRIGSIWTPNNFIMNYRILQKDIIDGEAGFNPVSMGELLYLEEADIQNFVAGKIVVLGDFLEADMHETLFEITSGPLILLNAYLTIQAGDTYVNFWFFLLIISVYICLSYIVFVKGDPIEKAISIYWGKNKLASYLSGFMSYLIVLTLLSIITFFIFNIHLNVFFLAVAFYIIDKTIGFINSKIIKN